MKTVMEVTKLILWWNVWLLGASLVMLTVHRDEIVDLAGGLDMSTSRGS